MVFSQEKEKLKILRTEEIPLGFYDRELTKQQRDSRVSILWNRQEEDINQIC